MELLYFSWTISRNRESSGRLFIPLLQVHIPNNLSRSMTKPTKWLVPPVKTPVSLGILLDSLYCPPEEGLNPWLPFKPHSEAKDSGHTGQMTKLVCVLAGSTGLFVGFVIYEMPKSSFNVILYSHCLFGQKFQQRIKIIYKYSLILFSKQKSGPVESPHNKTNEKAIATSEDSDQPGCLPSLIRVFAVCMKKACVHPLSAQRRLRSD